MASLSNWTYVGRPNARQCSTRASTTVFAVTREVGHEATTLSAEAVGALDPALDGEEPYIEVTRHLAHRTAAPHRGHQVPAPPFPSSFSPMVSPSLASFPRSY